MEEIKALRARGLQTTPQEKKVFQHPVKTRNMRLAKRWGAHRHKCMLVVVGFLVLSIVYLTPFEMRTSPPPETHVSAAHRKLVHEYVSNILEGPCHHGNTRKHLLSRLPASSEVTQPFLGKAAPLPDDLFLFPPPFGFRGLHGKLQEVLKLMPDADSPPEMETASRKCHRCVVVGNGGILKGLELGPLIDRFDIVIRLNSGPLGEYSVDVGNRTSIRMSYPEGTPLHWVDVDPHTLFVAVVYKAVDMSWVSAMINRYTVPLWDWLFFWQKVPDQIPLEPHRFRLLNLQVIRETALDLLKYPPPRPRLWGWDQNIPTLGVSALNFASLLCDEVSLAGFGYNLTQQEALLHYYDHQPMSAMLQQTMHNVDRETQLLQSLSLEGAISDLTGGIHCTFCAR